MSNLSAAQNSYHVRLERINFTVSKFCNLRCKTCDYLYGASDKGTMNLDQIEQMLSDAVDLGLERLELSGGEPMVLKTIYDIIAMADKKGVETALVTNGTLIQEKQADQLIHAGLKSVVFSLDGFESTNDWLRGKGVFQKTVRAISLMKERRERLRYIKVNLVVSKANLHELFAFTRFLAEDLQVDQVSYNPFDKFQMTVERFEALKDKLLITEDLKHKLAEQLQQIITYAEHSPVQLSYPGFLWQIIDSIGKETKPVPTVPCNEPMKGCCIDCGGQVYGCWGQYNRPVGNVTQKSLKEITASAEYQAVCNHAHRLTCEGCLKSIYDSIYAKSIA
jgi:MoaA/NifB/PqqE/SkfB family radical SAM enzyme